MQLKTTGIVFRSVKYAETSVIADIFTEDKGLHTFIAGGVRSARARMPYSLFQPMMVVDLVAYYRDDPNAMNRLREMRVAEVWQRIPFDIRRGAVALFMAEICRKCIQETEENRELFHFLIHTLRWLDQTSLPSKQNAGTDGYSTRTLPRNCTVERRTKNTSGQTAALLRAPRSGLQWREYTGYPGNGDGVTSRSKNRELTGPGGLWCV